MNEPCVYVAKRGNFIKVGFSRTPISRARDLGAALLAYAPGGLAEEAWAHAYLRASWVHGEWFALTGRALRLADNLGAIMGATRARHRGVSGGILVRRYRLALWEVSRPRAPAWAAERAKIGARRLTIPDWLRPTRHAKDESR